MLLDQAHVIGALATAIPALIAVFRSQADANKSRRESIVVKTEAEAQQTAAFVRAYEHSRADLEQARSFAESAYAQLSAEKNARKQEFEESSKTISRMQTQLLALHRELSDLRDSVFSAVNRPDKAFKDHTMIGGWRIVSEGSQPPTRRDHTGPYKLESDNEITKVERPSGRPLKKE